MVAASRSRHPNGLARFTSIAFLPLAICSVRPESGLAATTPLAATPVARTPAAKAQVPDGADAILHMFDFPYRRIVEELPYIVEAGFGAIQISPPQLSNGSAWWGRYQPLDYRVIDGPLGDEADLRRLVDEARARGIRIYADLVLNHMANLGCDFDLTYPPAWVRARYGVGISLRAEDFHPAFCIRDWSNPREVRNGRLCGEKGDTGLPDLRQDSWAAREAHRAFIAKLDALGIRGYRIDAVKHMEPSYFEPLFASALPEGRFVYGEVIAGAASYDRDLGPYLAQTGMAFMDFPLHETLRAAFGPRGDLTRLVSPASVKGALPPSRSVTFAINHDIPNNDGMRDMTLTPEDERLAYSYLLGRAGGTPHVYSDRGRAGGLRDDRWKDAHRDPGLKAMLRFHNALRGEDERVVFADGCVYLLRRGARGLLALNRCNVAWRGWFDLAQDGAFGDVLNGEVRDHGGVATIDIPARGARMLLSEGAPSAAPAIPTVEQTTVEERRIP